MAKKRKMKRMTGEQFFAIRQKLGLTQAAFGALLGYTGPQMVNSFEGNRREIPTQTGLLMEAIDKGFWSKTWPKPQADEAEAA